MKRNFFTIVILFLLFSPIFTAFAEGKTKILIVPGHDDVVWGAQYGNIKEADMNLALATKIYNILKKDKKLEVYITRNSKGYTKEFTNYFETKKDEIKKFRDEAKIKSKEKVSTGEFVKVKSVPHNAVNPDVSVKLYGINKWANDNKIDAVIHVHFNDYPRKTKWTKGKHKGFVVYYPEDQMANFVGSSVLAKKIFNELNKKYQPSDYEFEKGGFIKEQNLIALGSNNSLDANVRSVLIEYGYIYRFGNIKFRQKFYKDASALTASAIKNYFKK